MAARDAVAVVSKVEARRLELRSEGGCRFVDTATFVDLLVAPRTLRRANDPVARVRGLLDPTVGVRFLIEEEKLLDGESPAESLPPRLATDPRRALESR